MSEGFGKIGDQDKDKELGMDEEIQKAFNDTVGEILTYLDEAGVGLAVKRAVKASLWDLCDNKIKGIGTGEDYEGRFNR